MHFSPIFKPSRCLLLPYFMSLSLLPYFDYLVLDHLFLLTLRIIDLALSLFFLPLKQFDSVENGLLLNFVLLWLCNKFRDGLHIMRVVNFGVEFSPYSWRVYHWKGEVNILIVFWREGVFIWIDGWVSLMAWGWELLLKHPKAPIHRWGFTLLH